MRPLALKWRLSLLMAAAIAVSIGVICAIVYAETRELYYQQTDLSLLTLARAADDVANDAPSPADSSANLSVLFPSSARQASTVARIWTEDGQVIHAAGDSGIDWGETLGSLARPAAGQHQFFSITLAARDYRGVWLSSTRKGLGIVVAQATAKTQAELKELLRNLVLIGAGAIAATGALVVLLVQVGLRPIHLVAGHLRKVEANTLAQMGLEPQNVPDELAPFVDALAQMLCRLDDAMRRQKAFIADASHELRTPLAVAKSTIQTALAARRSAGEYQQSLQETLEDLRRMEHLVDELLLLARLDEGAAAAPDQPVQIDHLLAELADSFGPRVSQAGGKLTCSLSPAVVAGDDRQLSRLFSNLLDNALRHGPKGGAVQLNSETSPRQVVIVVGDEGGDIPAEIIPRLFERFFRIDGSRASATGGVGLGMAIAREIVIRHGGTIEITSQPSRGTRVVVTLPVMRPQSQAE